MLFYHKKIQTGWLAPAAPPVAIVGDGRYGLSLAARPADAGIEHHIIDSPVYAWLNISEDIPLNSAPFFFNLDAPGRSFQASDSCEQHGLTYHPLFYTRVLLHGMFNPISSRRIARPMTLNVGSCRHSTKEKLRNQQTLTWLLAQRDYAARSTWRSIVRSCKDEAGTAR
jgi:hypothetical protein